jgi:hypothetical protein
MNKDDAMAYLLKHSDPAIRYAANVIEETDKARLQTLNLVKDALGQLRMDVSYLVFDLEATRRERDALKGGA